MGVEELTAVESAGVSWHDGIAESGESSSGEGTAANDISKDGMLQSGEDKLGGGSVETSWKEETVPSGLEGS